MYHVYEIILATENKDIQRVLVYKGDIDPMIVSGEASLYVASGHFLWFDGTVTGVNGPKEGRVALFVKQ